MDNITILAIALGLSFDTFAVSMSLGIVRNKILFLQAVEVASILAVFQGGLTVTGYFLGSFISSELKSADHWVALALLAFLGLKMIIEGIKRTGEESGGKNYNNRIVIMTIAIGTSIDAFAVGISFAILFVRIWKAGLLIALVTFLASMTAIRIGKSAGARLGTRVEILGGVMLIAIGIKIFVEHILAS